MRLRRPSALIPNAPRVAALVLLVVAVSGGAQAAPAPAPAPVPGAGHPLVEKALRVGRSVAEKAAAWYQATPASDRVTSGGLAACGLLGGLVLLERLARIRRRKVVPRDFMRRYEERLREGRLDRGKALDLCELNPSPAAKVALVAIKRWGRPVTDLERAVSMAIRVESDRLRRNVGTLRRLAAMAPLLGLLGTLFSASRALSQPGGAAWGPALAQALAPLTAGVGMAILFLVAYDGLMGRVEGIVAALDKIGAETVDAIAMAAPIVEPKPAPEPRVQNYEPRHQPTHHDARYQAPDHRRHGGPAPRTPHQIRVDIPDAMIRAMEQDEDLYDV